MNDNPHRRLGLGMTIAMWVIVLGLITMLLQSWGDRQYNPNADLDDSMLINANGIRELVLDRNRWGHYVASGSINGHSVVFILDTGASDISVPSKVASRIGLIRGREKIYQTANGTIRAYATTLDHVDLGGIALNRVRASINPYMEGDEVLLGMSFLKHLEFSQKGDALTLRQSPPDNQH